MKGYKNWNPLCEFFLVDFDFLILVPLGVPLGVPRAEMAFCATREGEAH